MEASWTNTDKINSAVGALTVAIAVVFWVQRDYTTEHGGTWADPVIILFGALGALLMILGLLRRHVGRDTEDENQLPLLGLAKAGVLLVAWVAALPYLGYIASGIVFFILTALAMRTGRPRVRGIVLDVVVSAVLVAAVYLVFTEVLYVRLPSPAF